MDGREGCYGAMHCDLLLFKLYVHCSIYHVLYLSTFQSPCPPSMVFCVCGGGRGGGWLQEASLSIEEQ